MKATHKKLFKDGLSENDVVEFLYDTLDIEKERALLFVAEAKEKQ